MRWKWKVSILCLLNHAEAAIIRPTIDGSAWQRCVNSVVRQLRFAKQQWQRAQRPPTIETTHIMFIVDLSLSYKWMCARAFVCICCVCTILNFTALFWININLLLWSDFFLFLLWQLSIGCNAKENIKFPN